MAVEVGSFSEGSAIWMTVYDTVSGAIRTVVYGIETPSVTYDARHYVEQILSEQVLGENEAFGSVGVIRGTLNAALNIT